MKLIEVLKEHSKLSKNENPITIRYLSNIVPGNMDKILEVLLARESLSADIKIGEFNNYTQETFSPDNSKPGLPFSKPATCPNLSRQGVTCYRKRMTRKFYQLHCFSASREIYAPMHRLDTGGAHHLILGGCILLSNRSFSCPILTFCHHTTR